MGNMTWGPIVLIFWGEVTSLTLIRSLNFQTLKVSTNDNDNPSPGGSLWREI